MGESTSLIAAFLRPVIRWVSFFIVGLGIARAVPSIAADETLDCSETVEERIADLVRKEDRPDRVHVFVDATGSMKQLGRIRLDGGEYDILFEIKGGNTPRIATSPQFRDFVARVFDVQDEPSARIIVWAYWSETISETHKEERQEYETMFERVLEFATWTERAKWSAVDDTLAQIYKQRVVPGLQGCAENVLARSPNIICPDETVILVTDGQHVRRKDGAGPECVGKRLLDAACQTHAVVETFDLENPPQWLNPDWLERTQVWLTGDPASKRIEEAKLSHRDADAYARWLRDGVDLNEAFTKDTSSPNSRWHLLPKLVTSQSGSVVWLDDVNRIMIGDRERIEQAGGERNISRVSTNPLARSDVSGAVALWTDGRVACSGALIRSDIVLTARHCLPVSHVGFGARGRTFKVAVEGMAGHPKHDLALLRLARPVDEPVLDYRVAEQDEEPYGLLRVPGYGALRASGVGAGELRAKDLVAHGWGCSPARARRLGCRPEAELLIGSQGGADTCIGDSGAALLEPVIAIRDADSSALETDGWSTVLVEGSADGRAYCTWRIVGVTSRAADARRAACGGGGIYVRMDTHAGWVNEVIRNWTNDEPK